jgi:hypothetical protein
VPRIASASPPTDTPAESIRSVSLPRSSRGFPSLKRRDLGRDPFFLCDRGHPGVGLDGKDLGASFGELHRGNPSAGAHIKNMVGAEREQVVDQLVGVARTMCVVAVGRATK